MERTQAVTVAVENVGQAYLEVLRARGIKYLFGNSGTDFGPIIGPTDVEGFFVDVGWGTYGFKAGPVAGESVAAMVADGRPGDLIRPFGLDRFEKGTLTAEKGAAAVGH